MAIAVAVVVAGVGIHLGDGGQEPNVRCVYPVVKYFFGRYPPGDSKCFIFIVLENISRRIADQVKRWR